ncbi:hypothetical protein [Streptomyces sp. NBC_01296]|uniref:hypothetical protein n=1 Tax=Streptomyces sp. NBC_01296 TaxID=2903816 RepID=UPI002E160F43|nr:hypothetical protein OG299_15330 [Streptomyces sp. NBC_01296]WSW61627.1 hypothetical protein OG513_25300 [Streptomyces sp. NBC_00998]
MISEPELEGEWDTGRPAAPAQEPDAPRERVRGPRTAWLWALGGAVLASAVWVGVLVAQDRFASAPRIAYRHTEDLCEAGRLAALAKTEVQPGHGFPTHGEHPGLDWSYCSYNGDYVDGQVSYQVQAMTELHKKTDPEAEFGTGPWAGWGIFGGGAGTAEQVSGLGERAEFHEGAGGSGPRLQVLDGGAVFTLNVQWFGPDARFEPDGDAIKAAMIEDMRALMTALRK